MALPSRLLACLAVANASFASRVQRVVRIVAVFAASFYRRACVFASNSAFFPPLLASSKVYSRSTKGPLKVY
jgi:hypothetical protein